MHLFVTRHGKANADSESGRDEDCELRARGVRQAEYLGEELRKRDMRPTIVYSSGLVRAEQTADVIGEILGAKREHEPMLGLGHRATDVIEVLELIRRKNNDASLMLVGHNPQVESLIAVLSGGPTASAHRMRTGTCVILRTRGKPTKDDHGLIGNARIVETLRLDD